MSKIRWGIAGPGVIAHKFAEAIGNVDTAELAAVASRSQERAEEFASEFNIPNAFSSYEEMAASPLIDAVYISTAHPFHKSCAEIFLNTKKHVLCEKPLCVNAKQAKELKLCAEKNGVFLMEAMWTRFLPAIKEAKAIIDSGEIGEVMGMNADFCYSIECDEDPKLFKNELAGGSLLDVGVYALHLASVVFDDNPQSISAFANIDNGVDLHTQMLLKYKSGAIAALSSATKLEKPADAYIYGTKGSIYIPEFYQADKLVVRSGGNEKTLSLAYDGNGFEGEIREVCTCINNGKNQSEILPLDESIKIIEQMDFIRKQIGLVYPMDK
ncbi:MAG: Gfo/Idh/MocA family oxidoreductase [Clostridia bacterium]|nr:Gfo/Idh/MocA family oxidoreductase [Clostridia bacterium]